MHRTGFFLVKEKKHRAFIRYSSVDILTPRIPKIFPVVPPDFYVLVAVQISRNGQKNVKDNWSQNSRLE